MEAMKTHHFKYRSKIVALCFFASLFFSSVHGQDIENLLEEKKYVKVNGGVTANTTFYDANGIENRRDPFYWMLNANINFNILGIIQAPFSMTISQQEKRFSQPQPFNRFGISPKYKGVTAHFGHRTMNFSEYTLAGNMFLGAGVEYAPEGKFYRVSAMYGRLAKAVERSAQEGLVFAKPTFKRTGYGLKLGLGRKKHLVDLIFFRAGDDENSIIVTEEVDVTPEENLVTSIHSKHEISERLAVEFEYAYSLFTRDTRAVEIESSDYTFINNLGGLFKPNLSSEYSNALTSVVNYNGDWYQANLKYRKVDPGYRTLGSSFLNNGMEDITGGLSWGMFQRKIDISTNAGIQTSNDESSVVRVIYALNANFNMNERLNLSSSYSNFSTSTRQTQIQRDMLTDTLEYFQVTRTASVNMNYKIGDAKYGRTLMVSANVQDATDSQQNASTFYSLNVGHQMKIANQWQFALSAAYNKNYSAQMENTSVGPVANLSRSFLEGKVRSACAVAMLNSYMGNSIQSKVTNISVTNNFRVAKKHSFAVNIYYLNNEGMGEQARKFSEIRGMFNYGYNF